MEPVTAEVTGAAPGTPPVWQGLLAARRTELNALLAQARAGGAAPDALRKALVEMGPGIEQLSRAVPREALDLVTPALVATVCELVQAKLWTERSAQRWALLTVLPAVPVALTRSPQVCLQVLTTGAARLSRSTDLAAWGRRLTAADAFLTSDDELRLGATVAAWRSGLVRSRGAALRAAASLSDAALAALLDLPADQPGAPSAREVLAANAADPFCWPQVPASGLLATYGGHRGLGGAWTSVPRVLGAHRTATPTWSLMTDDGDWVLIADVHGHTIMRAPAGAQTPVVATDDLDPSAVAPLLTWADEVTGAHRATRGPAPVAAPVNAPFAAPPVLVSRRSSFRVSLVRVP